MRSPLMGSQPVFSGVHLNAAILLEGVDVRLPGKGNLNFQGAWPVRRIISTIQWIGASKLSIKKSLSLFRGAHFG